MEWRAVFSSERFATIVRTKTKSSWDMTSVYEGLDRLASTSPLPHTEFYPLSAPGVTETSKIMGVESIQVFQQQRNTQISITLCCSLVSC